MASIGMTYTGRILIPRPEAVGLSSVECSFFILLFVYLFYYFGCPGFSLQRECFSLVAVSRGWPCTDVSLQWLFLLRNTGFRCRRVYSCSVWAQELCSGASGVHAQ